MERIQEMKQLLEVGDPLEARHKLLKLIVEELEELRKRDDAVAGTLRAVKDAL
jgi:hypothetical protein